ncbi:MAG: hypothetical protein WBD37_12810 [Anderseniella sp.]
MSVDVHERRVSGSGRDSVEFNIIFSVAFVFFLVAAMAHRIIPKRWRPNLDPSGQARSVIAEARIAASNSIPFAFM